MVIRNFFPAPLNPFLYTKRVNGFALAPIKSIATIVVCVVKVAFSIKFKCFGSVLVRVCVVID